MDVDTAPAASQQQQAPTRPLQSNPVSGSSGPTRTQPSADSFIASADSKFDGITFTDLKLLPSLLRAVQQVGYTSPTPIQQKAIPFALTGRDVLGCAQTGTGKSAAFCLPILQRLSLAPLSQPSTAARPIRCLVLTPTRELALQIHQSFTDYGAFLPLTAAVIFGGVGQGAQETVLRKGVDVLVACPGRLLDLMGQKLVHLNNVNVFVLDEADRMLDMGFLPDVKRIIPHIPKQRQTLFFSATMPPPIKELASSLLVNHATVEVAPVSSTVDKIEQSLYMLHKGYKPQLLVHLLQDPSWTKVLVFTRTKHGANKVTTITRVLGRNPLTSLVQVAHSVNSSHLWLLLL